MDLDVGGDSLIRPSIREAVDSLQWLEAEGQQHLDNLRQKQRERRLPTASKTSHIDSENQERCLICTLPLGSCQHDEAWLAAHEEEAFASKHHHELAKEIDDMLDVIKFVPIDFSTLPPVEDIDLDHMQWQPLEEELVDKIGSSNVKLFIPDRRAWHSATLLEDNYLVVFGGLRSAVDLPQPFTAISPEVDIEILSDVRVYDVAYRSWKGVITGSASSPCGRYGHCAAALSHCRLWIFGGRGANNQLLQDMWIFHLTSSCWEKIEMAPSAPLPSPRFHAGCVSIRSREGGEETEIVYLFGGTDGLDALDDLWLCHLPVVEASTSIVGIDRLAGIYWSRGVAGGIGPGGKYGHQLVYSALTQSIYLTGGCSLSPRSEVISNTNSVEENIQLMHLSRTLQSRYQTESDVAVVGSAALHQHIRDMPSTVSEFSSRGQSMDRLASIYREASDLTATIHMGEQDARRAELELVDAYKQAQARLYYKQRHRNHATGKKASFMVTYRLQLQSAGGLLWQMLGPGTAAAQTFPKISGQLPTDRMFHGAACIGSFLFIMGGSYPSSLFLKHVDEISELVAEQQYTPLEVYVLDLQTLSWRHYKPTNSLSLYQDLLKLAEKDVINARLAMQREKMTAKSLGVAGDQRTKEEALAEAFYHVCLWRRDRLFHSIRQAHSADENDCQSEDDRKAIQNRLRDYIYKTQGALDNQLMLDDKSALVISPYSRLGCTVTAVRQRVVVVGGFPPAAKEEEGSSDQHKRDLLSSVYRKQKRANAFKYRAMVLDVEQEMERRRRMEEEHYAKLEVERHRIEAETNMEQLLSAHELREFIVQERRNQERELALMAKMDYLSSLPPLSRPGAVRLVKANRHTLWLSWDRIYRDTRNRLVSEEDVVYFLYLKVGFENIRFGSRVLVLPSELDSQMPQSSTLGLGLGLGLHIFADDLVSPSKSKSRKKNKRQKQLADKNSLMNLFMIFDDNHRRFPGEIVKIWGEGSFDVKFDDGSFESRVPRHRIRVSPPSPVLGMSHKSPGSLSMTDGSVLTEPLDDDTFSQTTATPTLSSHSRTLGSYGRRLQERQRRRQEAVEALRERFCKPVLLFTDNRLANLSLTAKQSQQLQIEPKAHPYYRLLLSPANSATESSQRSSLENCNVLSINDGSVKSEDLRIERAITTFAHASLQSVSSQNSSRSSSVREDKSSQISGQAKHIPTVQVGDDWRLVYIGTDNSYACSNLIPDHILEQENGLKVPVIACLQTLGLDYPHYERSQLSNPRAFFTLSVGEHEAKNANGEDASSSLNIDGEAPTSLPLSMSRTKRDIITAVLADQQVIHIERRAQTYSAEGVGDQFL